MNYIVYVLAGFLFLTSLNATDQNTLSTATFNAEKKNDSMITIAGLPWHSDINRAYTVAAKENKHVIVMVANEYCPWCKKMKEQTFTDTRIKKKLEKYTLVIMQHYDKSIRKHIPIYNCTVPSLFFMHYMRELIDKAVGYFFGINVQLAIFDGRL